MCSLLACFCSTRREWSRWQRNTRNTPQKRISHLLTQWQQVLDSSWRLSSCLSSCLLLVTCPEPLVWWENEQQSGHFLLTNSLVWQHDVWRLTKILRPIGCTVWYQHRRAVLFNSRLALRFPYPIRPVQKPKSVAIKLPGNVPIKGSQKKFTTKTEVPLKFRILKCIDF